MCDSLISHLCHRGKGYQGGKGKVFPYRCRRTQPFQGDGHPDKMADRPWMAGSAAQYERKSLSKVTPFSYTDSEGNIITYYCCQTTYLSDEYGEDTGLNTDAIGMVIDFTQIQNRRDCSVNAYAAFRCEMGERSYLCWTISPEISCVIEYNADVNDEADIFRMAESVQQPNE